MPEGIVIPGYEISQPDLAGLETLLHERQKTQIVILEAPVHAYCLPQYLGETAGVYETEFIQPISSFIGSKDVLFLRSIPAVDEIIPDEGWYDLKHLNSGGAEFFSKWLADQIADAVQSGIIVDPFVD